ncbi:MAG: HI0074 family nucleotidyltransferase substrate-binding subunit [Thermoanaerobaculia bacterium]
MTAPLDRLLRDLTAALDRLGEALREPKSDIVRDAAIQRFEFSFELFWKALKARAESDGLRVVSPRDALRAAFQLGLLADDDLVFQMLEDRNRTSHLYNAAMAEDVFSRIPAYQALMAAVARALSTE